MLLRIYINQSVPKATLALPGSCWSDAAIDALALAQGIVAAATDIILLTLPVVFLWKVKIAWPVKLGICSLMALAFAHRGGAFAAVRTAMVPGLTTTRAPTWELFLYLCGLQWKPALVSLQRPHRRFVRS
ncbi:hypothetical protein MAC_09796 [Metarhizium acridum CQMa 102]|uniref:Rhodopsin domain-containing protein n=1 Tax=Metarhizium acridum (strain CQMa 102) TaxID=655827 RepID=E9EIU8_METAQ|nr:uncharacterized protein MAC_09796 [Metarhizium acridum CQMa 102]EFY84158.1 hypothetical protein MAC_09796 [Metarhizium acridum CQMa 102]